MVLTLSCRDTPGIVGAVGSFLAERDCNILESAQFGDEVSGRFFMRVLFEQLGGVAAAGDAAASDAATGDAAAGDAAVISAAFAPVAARFAMTSRFRLATDHPRVLVLVSKHDHCLNDLLYRHRIGALPMELVAVASNHPDAGPLVAAHGIAFHHLPVTAATRDAQERAILDLVQASGAELVVLARYMQILSDALCTELAGRAINIHHSFLPGFKGARPYHQAHARGVKLIGATAHYVTSDLDEGPIIEQRVTPVNHAMSPDTLAAIGRDVECQTLASAVRLHLEGRVFLNGGKTVVLP